MPPDGLSPYCHHFHRAVQMIARRWTPEILRALLAGTVRFSGFTAVIPGLSDRLLSERLKDLEAEGIVVRTVTPATPVRVEYRLTAKGEDLATAIGAIAAWAERWVTEREAVESEAGSH
ncbi:MAG TPA: helix-turn-helix domain-containing protein [Actinomycetota bacterium]|nr:helix-turn-helix domain-containing protein [Actinomycetota bacterium]